MTGVSPIALEVGGKGNREKGMYGTDRRKGSESRRERERVEKGRMNNK